MAKPALPATNCKWNDNSFANNEVGDLRPKFDHLTHILVTENVTAFHGRLIAVQKMKIGTADRASRDFYDGIARMLNFWVRYGVNPHIPFAVPAKCSH